MNEKENIPAGPIVDQFPKYRLYNTIEELEKVLGYCPWNSTVHIGYYAPCRVDD